MGEIIRANYKTYQGYECLNACIVNRLREMKYDVTGSDVFFIGEGSDYIYREKENNNIVIANKQFEANFLFCKKSGLDYTVDYMRNCNHIIALEKAIEDYGCITIDVSTLYLNYNKVFEQREAFHFINVLKMDKDNNSIYISDGYVPTTQPSIYEGWIPFSEILKGWQKSNYKVLIIRGFKKNEKFKDELQKTYPYMLESLDRYILKQKDNCKIITVFEEILSLIDKKALFTEKIFNYHFQLKVNGFLSYKYFVLQQLQKYNSLLCNEFETLIKEWRRWLINLIKVAVECDYAKSKRCYDKGLLLARREKDMFLKIIGNSDIKR